MPVISKTKLNFTASLLSDYSLIQSFPGFLSISGDLRCSPDGQDLYCLATSLLSEDSALTSKFTSTSNSTSIPPCTLHFSFHDCCFSQDFSLFQALIPQLKAKILGDVALVLAVGHFPKLAVFHCLCFGRHGFVSACALNILQENTIPYLYN